MHNAQNGRSDAMADSAMSISEAIAVIAQTLQRVANDDEKVERAVVRVARTFAGTAGAEADSAGENQSTHRRRGGVDLDVVAQRALLKSQACRIAAGHAGGLDERTVNREARSHRGCFLWMEHSAEHSCDEAAMLLIAEIYENLSRTASFVQGLTLHDDRDTAITAEAYRLLAESQSALWVALTENGVSRDQDQIDAFIWLRERTRDERVYLDRFMRREDPADPSEWNSLRDRLGAMMNAGKASHCAIGE